MADPNQPSSSSQSDSGAGREEKPTVDRGFEYLKLVRDTFGSRKDSRYLAFVHLLKEFKKGKIETLKLIPAVKLMFEGHPELLSGFNIFLPRGYSIDSAAPKKDPILLENLTPVSDLLDKVQNRLQDDEQYSFFLDVLHRSAHACELNALKQLPFIFKDYPDLLAEVYLLYPQFKG